MVNSESIRSFSSFSFKGFSGERQNLYRAAVAELSVVTCIVPSVFTIQKAPGSSVSFNFHKDAKITLPSVPVCAGFQNIVVTSHSVFLKAFYYMIESNSF